MEPKQVGPNGGLERTPAIERSALNENGSNSPEGLRNIGLERGLETEKDIGAVQAEAQQVAMPSLPVPVINDSDDSANMTGSDDVNLVAKDDDLIEKEWVDKAKRIIAATKDDPYTREREIAKLQSEYILKRYGREMGTTAENE